jgi:hypothetical protein
MAVDERNRLQLAEAAKRLLGDDEGITLMELLPPVGWADVATKQDLALLETRMYARFDQVDARFGQVDVQLAQLESRIEGKLEVLEHKFTASFHQELRSQTWKMVAVVAAMSAMFGALVGVTRV